jgi:hypothetical protein
MYRFIYVLKSHLGKSGGLMAYLGPIGTLDQEVPQGKKEELAPLKGHGVHERTTGN